MCGRCSEGFLVTLLLSLQVKDLTKYLDPSGLGVISFEDFHRGIRAIRNGGESGAAVQVRPGRCQAPRRSGSELGWFAGSPRSALGGERGGGRVR